MTFSATRWSLSAYQIVAHVHDEVIVECKPTASVKEVYFLMASVPPWAEELVLRADEYEYSYYQKDN